MKHLICNSIRQKSNMFKIVFLLILILLIVNYITYNTSIFFRKNINLPFSLHLNKQDIVMIKGEDYRLFVYGINKRVSFSSTNFRVAGVNFNGRVFAHQTGKAIIVAKVDGKSLKCRVRVIDISKDKLSLKVGDNYSLKIKGWNGLTSWKSSNKSVATVNKFGKVQAKNKGRTVITAKIKGKVVKCIVNVK